MAKGIRGVNKEVLQRFRKVNHRLSIDRFIDVNRRFEKSLTYKVSRVSFLNIFLFWITLIFVLGIVYFLLSSYTSNDVIDRDGNPLNSNFSGFTNSLYFSFVTATTIGYGDLIPVGFIKVFAVVEAVLGLLVLGIVISKLVGIKQEAILEQLYEISFEESINELRSSLYLFRIESNKVMKDIESNRSSKDEIVEYISINLASLENSFRGIKKLMLQPKHEFLLSPDYPSTEILFEGISRSLKKLLGLVKSLDLIKIDIKMPYISGNLNSILSLSKEVCDLYPKGKASKTLLDTITEIKKDISQFKF